MLGKAQLQQQLVKEAMKTKSEQFAYEEFISRRPTRAASRMWPRGVTVRPYTRLPRFPNSIFYFALLATCLVHLGQHQVVVDAARKANSTRTWKEVNASCVEHKKFRLPQICALHIIVTPDKLVELTGSYEKSGHSRRSSPPWRRVLASSARTKASSPSRASSKQNVAAQHPQDAQGKCAPVGAHLPRPSKTLASR